MDRFTRIVLGYHGREPAFAEALIRGEVAVKDWKPSTNEYDWLGRESTSGSMRQSAPASGAREASWAR
jgi:hypothetical protein